MRRSLLILIIALNALAFVALGVGMVFVADAPRPSFYFLVGALAGLLFSVAGLSCIVLISTVRRPRGLPLDPDATMVHIPPPGVPERRSEGAGRRVTDVGPSDIVRIAHAIKMSAGPLRNAPISEAVARAQGLLDPLDLVQDDEVPREV
jgi:hypothetical protein